MSSLKVTIRGEHIARILRAAADKAPEVLAATINTVAAATKQAMVPVLTAQSALPRKTIDFALKVDKATRGTLTATIHSAGGNISLKYFQPHETAEGVSAAPHGQRRLYAHTFMKAGWWPNRVDKPKWHGQVLERVGGKSKTGMDKFRKVRSDEYIPTEMVTGASAEAFKATSEAQLGAAIDKAVAGLLAGSGKK